MAIPKKKTVAKKGTAKLVKIKTNMGLKADELREKTYIYKVEEGVVMTGVRSSSLDIKFPFALMKVGDSFLIPANDENAKKANTLLYAARQFAKFQPGFNITSRLQLNGARRVWRLK
jgi:hypothetical protein